MHPIPRPSSGTTTNPSSVRMQTFWWPQKIGFLLLITKSRRKRNRWNNTFLCSGQLAAMHCLHKKCYHCIIVNGGCTLCFFTSLAWNNSRPSYTWSTFLLPWLNRKVSHMGILGQDFHHFQAGQLCQFCPFCISCKGPFLWSPCSRCK